MIASGERWSISNFCTMSALDQKQTLEHVRAMSALLPKADILTQRITDLKTGIAAGCSKQRGRVLPHSLAKQ